MFTGQDVSKIRKFSRQKNVVSFFCDMSSLCHCVGYYVMLVIVAVTSYDSATIPILTQDSCRSLKVLEFLFQIFKAMKLLKNRLGL